MRDKGNASFGRLLRRLRKNLPLRYPVRVRRCRLPRDTFGDCRFDEESEVFTIRVNCAFQEPAQLFALIHEYAHARAWFVETEDHDAHFGIELARCWRQVDPDFEREGVE